MRRTKIYDRIISLSIVIALVLSTFSGCYNSDETNSSSYSSSTVTTDMTTKQIADTITSALREDAEEQKEAVKISFDPNDYAGDIDAFVYGLIVSEYELCYNVFSAAAELPDGEMVYGIAYTDYAERYDSDDGMIFFPAGFISLIGEPTIPDNALDNGLEIIDLESENPEYGFVLAYDTEPYTEHCVIWDQYLQYGVDDNGQIVYKAVHDGDDVYDESIGSLYSYDKGEYILNYEVGEYKPLTGESLSGQLNYEDIEAEMNRLIEEQNKHFSDVEIETIVAEAPEYLESALLSMQTETFMGYQVSELIELAKTIDANECITITPDGIVIDIKNEIPKSPNALTKWMVGISCGILVIGSVAVDMLIPAARPLSGAISGAATDVFFQVLYENQTLDNVNWGKVAVSAVSGAAVAWLCPLGAKAATDKIAGAIGKKTIEVCGQKIATETLAKLGGYGVLTCSNALVAGVTNAAYAKIDNKSDKETLDAFLSGAAIGAAFTVVGSVLSEAPNVIDKKWPNSWLNKATTSLSSQAEKASTFIGDHQIHLKNQALEDILSPASINATARNAIKIIEENEFNTELLKFEKLKLDQLPADTNSNFYYTDIKGNILTKKDLMDNGINGCIRIDAGKCESELLKYSDNVFNVVEGDLDFGDASLYSFYSNEPITCSRKFNYTNYDDQLIMELKNNRSELPDKLMNVLDDIETNNTSATKALSKAKITYHERMNGEIQLVETALHSKLGHSGGVAQAKAYAMIETVTENFEYISRLKSSSVFGTLIDNAA